MDYLLDFVLLCINEKHKKMAYEMYITDCLKIIAENTAKFAGGSTLKVRYHDMVTPKQVSPNRQTAKSIIDKFKRKIGMKQGGEN